MIVPKVFRRASVAVLVGIETTLQAALETDELGIVIEAQPTWMVWQGAAQSQLWQPLIGRDVGYGGALVGMYLQPGVVMVALPAQPRALIKEIIGGDAQIGIQILKVIGITDLGVVHIGAQARADVGGVLPAVHPALVAVFGLLLALVFTVIQYRGTDLTLAARCEITELALQLQPPVGHQGRIQGGIIVGRQVE